MHDHATELWWTRLDAEPLVKGETVGDGMGLIRGIASTEHRDKDREIIRQDGIVFDDVCRLTLEHPSSVVNQVGEVLEHRRVLEKGLPATQIDGGLYLGDPDAYSAKLYKAARMIAKSGGRAQFGFSVEGEITSRDPSDRSIITGCRVTSVAVTMGPRNTFATWAPIMKGLLGSTRVAVDPVHAVLARGLSTTDLQVAHLMRRRPDLVLSRAEAVAALRSAP